MVEAAVVDTLETTPPAATHWSSVELARKHGISHTTVTEIWRTFSSVFPDPHLIERSATASVYLNPPVAVVVAVDQKPQVRALKWTAPTLLMLLPTTPTRATHDYVCNGTLV